MEHLNYACHPQEFFTKLDCFAHDNWAVATVRGGRGVQVATVCTLPRHVDLQHYEVSVGRSGVGLRPGLLEVPVADVLGIA